jgi:hypothetical protein
MVALSSVAGASVAGPGIAENGESYIGLGWADPFGFLATVQS